MADGSFPLFFAKRTSNFQEFALCFLRPAYLDTSIYNVERMMALAKRVRSPIVDGLFYPTDSAGVMSFMIDIGLKRGRGSQARAIIAPHGAWEISGSLAGAAFASAAGRCNPSRVVVMGPIHNNMEEGVFLSNSHSFQTPLGDIRVDQEASGWLESYSPLITIHDIPHLHEHSIEVLLPFVKYFFPEAAIVPILMGGQGKQNIRVLADALHAVFEPIMEDTLLVVSFNLTVYPDNPVELETIEECMRLFREGKQRQLQKAFDSGKITGCGGALVSALLQSTLLDGTRPSLASESLLSALGEHNKTVYYGAFSFV